MRLHLQVEEASPAAALTALATALRARDTEVGTLQCAVNDLARRERALVVANDGLERELRTLRTSRSETRRMVTAVCELRRSCAEELHAVGFSSEVGDVAPTADVDASDGDEARDVASSHGALIHRMENDILRWTRRRADYTARNAALLLRVRKSIATATTDLDDGALTTESAELDVLAGLDGASHGAIMALSAKLAAQTEAWADIRRRLAVYDDLPPDRVAALVSLDVAKLELGQLTARVEEQYQELVGDWDM